MAIGCSNEGWKTPDAALFNMELAQEGEVFFVKMKLWLKTRRKSQRKRNGWSVFSIEEEYELWIAREEEIRGAGMWH
jgi:hypothetical protein